MISVAKAAMQGKDVFLRGNEEVLRTAELHTATDQTDYDIAMGMMVLLGATSAFGALPLTQAVAVIHGALRSEKFRIYLGSNDRPSAALLWAHLGEESAADYLDKGYLADPRAWSSGNDLWFIHVIADGGKIKDIIADAVESPIFRDHERAFMLRVGPTGRRRIVSFTRDGMQLVRTLAQ